MKRAFTICAVLVFSVFFSTLSGAFDPSIPVPILETRTLTVNVSGLDGYDRVVSDPAGIDCTSDGGSCSALFIKGIYVALAAVPVDGYTWTSSFQGWSGDCSGTGEACLLLMDSDRNVTAFFGALGIPATMFTVNVAINGEGTVISSPEGLTCSASSCTGMFPSNTPVALEAVPDEPPEGYTSFFVEWSGNCSGSGPCPLYMDSDKTVTAQFGMLAPPAFAIPAPSGQNSFSYHPVGEPVVALAPGDCRPFAIGSEADAINLRIKLPVYSEAIDVYVAITVPGSTEFWLLGPGDAVSPLSSGLVKWKDNSLFEDIDQTLFGQIPAALLPQGTYRLYLMVTPAGDASFLNYHLWTTYFDITPPENVFDQ